MAHLVLYRKYRPQLFAEVVGQEHVVRTITNALKSGEVGHAYLFSGPRGTGKTTVARLLAKAVNCANVASEAVLGGRADATLSIRRSSEGAKADSFVEPCNTCIACVEITRGNAMDVVEIDAASHRGIDEVRELKEMMRVSPARLPYRIFIIDEVHMLTKEAFNALLKSLEEPPPHTIFILATTEAQRLPATIVSRTQRFDFKRLRLHDIAQRLEGIAKKEDVRIGRDALQIIARTADGSGRDAESLFAKLMNFKGNDITKQDVEEILGVVDQLTIEELLRHLSQKKVEAAISLINRTADEGYDLGELAKSTVRYLRTLLLAKLSPESLGEGFNEEEAAAVRKISESLLETDITRLIELFMRAERETKSSILPQLPLELAVVEYLRG